MSEITGRDLIANGVEEACELLKELTETPGLYSLEFKFTQCGRDPVPMIDYHVCKYTGCPDQHLITTRNDVSDFSTDGMKEFNIQLWIPVIERLPSVGQEVYVTDGEYIARANLLDEVFPGDQPCWSYSGIGEPTHWCEKLPLPKTKGENRCDEK